MGLLGGIPVEYLFLPVGSDAVAERIVVLRSDPGIDHTLVDHQGILGGIQDLAHAPRIGNSVREIIGYMGLSLDAFLSRHKDDTVGSPGSVHGSRSCILENLDALNICRIQVIDAAFDRHSVHYI